MTMTMQSRPTSHQPLSALNHVRSFAPRMQRVAAVDADSVIPASNCCHYPQLYESGIMDAHTMSSLRKPCRASNSKYGRDAHSVNGAK